MTLFDRDVPKYMVFFGLLTETVKLVARLQIPLIAAPQLLGTRRALFSLPLIGFLGLS